MKLLTNSKALNETLKAVGKALPSKSVLPIIENFLFEIDGNFMKVSATNLEQGMSSKVAIEYKGKPLKVAVPGKIMTDILGTLPDQPITISIGEAFEIAITSDSGTYKMSGFDGSDFPEGPESNSQNMLIPAGMMRRLLEKTLFAASVDADKVALNGVYLKSERGDLHAAATDAHRLQAYTMTNTQLGDDFEMIVPLKAASILQSMIGMESSILFSFNSSHAFFTCGQTTLSCRLIDQKYPDYQNVIPKNSNKVLEVEKSAFMAALKRVKIFANKSTHQVALSCKGAELELACIDVDFANEAIESIPCEYDGADIEIGFNAELLYESCLRVEGDRIRVELSEPNRAGLLVAKEQNFGENIIGLVMPVMLNTYAK